MTRPSYIRGLLSRARMAAVLWLIVGPVTAAAAADMSAGSTAEAGMAHMSGHMYMTTLRAVQPGDRQKADAVLAAAKVAMAPYKDYRKALADGYEIFLPNIPQPQYHFTNYGHALAARSQFDPLKPTSLLYTKTADGGYKLVGVMYTDRVDAGEEEINDRIPLSVARWHQHVNLCLPPLGMKLQDIDFKEFGPSGSIATQTSCDAAGGRWYPVVLGWMVHVYPFERDLSKTWAH
jgi:hypothetical protein